MTAYLLGRSLVGMRAEDVVIAARVLSEWESGDAPAEVHLIANGEAEAPAIHAAALESALFASVRVSGDTPLWSEVVRDPLQGRMSGTVHGALRVYDLPDLLAAYRSLRKQEPQP